MMDVTRQARSWPFPKLLIWILGIVVLALVIWMFYEYLEPRAQGSAMAEPDPAQRPGTIAQRMLDAELIEFHSRLEKIFDATEVQSDAREAAERLGDQLAEFTVQMERLRHHQEREDRLLDISAQAAAQTVSNLAGIVQFLSILFTLVLFGVTLIAGLHTRELREEWQRIEINAASVQADLVSSKQASEEATTKADDAVRIISSKSNEIKEQLDNLTNSWDEELRELREERESMVNFSTRLMTAVPESLKSILSELSRQITFSPEATKRIDSRIQVFSAYLKVIHPEARMRRVGIDELAATGTKDAEIILKKLLEESSLEGYEALQIQRALKQNSEAMALTVPLDKPRRPRTGRRTSRSDKTPS